MSVFMLATNVGFNHAFCSIAKKHLWALASCHCYFVLWQVLVHMHAAELSPILIVHTSDWQLFLVGYKLQLFNCILLVCLCVLQKFPFQYISRYIAQFMKWPLCLG